MGGRRQRIGFVVAMVASVLLVYGAAWTQQPQAGGTLRVAWEADVAGLDPRLSPGAQAGYDERHPLRYTIMTHSAEAALPTIATILKTQYAKLGVDVTVEVLDRPIFLRRWQRDRDWDQILGVSGAAFDSYQLSRVLDTRAGNNTLNHDDTQVDALIDRMKLASG